MDERGGILHLGAPKCGSSALQTALSLQPALVDGAGRRHVYLAPPETDPEAPALTGRKLTAAAARSSRGYASWRAAPVQGGETGSVAGYWRHLGATLDKARAEGVVPILSNEGWIAQAPAFAAGLGADLEGMVAAAFVRPPVDWLNAAYWQWGIWSGISIDQWIAQAGQRYRLGRWLADWAALPGLRLVVRPAHGDVVAGFAEAFGLDLRARSRANTAAPPALIGLMLRHRRFRPDPHMPAVEFIFGRWCRMAAAERLWAIRPHHLERIAEATKADVDLLLARLPAPEAAALTADPAWRDPMAAADRAARRMRRLDHPEGLAALHHALSEGVAAASAATGLRPPVLAPAPGSGATVAEWDAALCPALDALIAADAAARSPIRRIRSRFFGSGTAPPLPDLFGPQARVQALTAPFARPETPHHALPAEHRPHEDRIAPLFGGRLGRAAGPARLAMPLLILAESEQAGGELLAPGLRATGLVRDGRILLHHAMVATILAKHPATDLPDYLRQAALRACHGGGTFCLRASWDQLAMALRCGLTEMFPAIRIVHLWREDALTQAVAASLAQQRRAGTHPPEMNPDEIARRITAQARADALIPMLADSAGIARMRLSHEALTARPRAGLRRVLAFCDLDPEAAAQWSAPKPGAAPDPEEAALIARYHAILRDALLPDFPEIP